MAFLMGFDFYCFFGVFQVYSAEVEKDDLDGPKDLGRCCKVSTIPCHSSYAFYIGVSVVYVELRVGHGWRLVWVILRLRSLCFLT